MKANEFFSQWSTASWKARQKSLEGLKEAVKSRSEPKWTEEHYKALELLIKDMEKYQNENKGIN